MAVIEPGAQGVGAVEPVAHELPAGHSVHSPAVVRLVALEKEPARHGSTALAPLAQKPPPSHSLHALSPSPS